MLLPIDNDSIFLINQIFSIYIIIGFTTLVIERAIDALVSARNV